MFPNGRLLVKIEFMNLFEPTDYQSITIHVKVKNLTSGLDIVAPSRGKDSNSENDAIQLIEFQEKGAAVFGFPKNSCASGHNLAMTLDVKNYKQQFKMSLTAKVLSVKSDQSEVSLAELQFVQYCQDEWSRLIELYSRRQQEILVFFEAVKGEV